MLPMFVRPLDACEGLPETEMRSERFGIRDFDQKEVLDSFQSETMFGGQDRHGTLAPACWREKSTGRGKTTGAERAPGPVPHPSPRVLHKFVMVTDGLLRFRSPSALNFDRG